MNLVDTHCHLDFNRFDTDRDEVIKRAIDVGVSQIIVPGLDIQSSRAAIQIADQYEAVFAAVGFHPNSIGSDPPDLDNSLNIIKELAAHSKVVAIGEIGLDYYWDKTPTQIQHQWLIRQLDLATEMELPVILHNRESTEDILSIVQKWTQDDMPHSLVNRVGVMHSFSGNQAAAEQTIELGLYLGFTGPLTFKNADELRGIAAANPGERLLIETDAPFLTPHPHRGDRNEPAYVRYVAERLANIRGIDISEAADLTTSNAVRLFKLPA